MLALTSATRRCYLGGDSTISNVFLDSDAYGDWLQYGGTVAPELEDLNRDDKDYLFPLSRSLNPNFKGVISVTGKVAVSGVLRGRVTLSATNDIILADDITYATDPGTGLCQDLLGIFSGDDVIVADNLLNSPVRDPDNEQLDAAMPRWSMAAQDLADLIGFLRNPVPE